MPTTPLNALSLISRAFHALKRVTRPLARRAGTPADASAHAGPPSTVRILAITSDDRFYSILVDAGSSCGWEIRRSSTVQEGLDAVRSLHVPLVIFDWDGSEQDWGHALDRIWAAPNHPCVLLASRLMNDNLRQEVQRHHGYDVLPRTGDRDRIVRTVEFAWFWTTHKYASI